MGNQLHGPDSEGFMKNNMACQGQKVLMCLRIIILPPSLSKVLITILWVLSYRMFKFSACSTLLIHYA